MGIYFYYNLRMKLKYIFITLAFIILPVFLSAQTHLEGKIYDGSGNDQTGLPGASVFWAGTTTGTSTNTAGYFNIKRVLQTNKLVISFVGYKTDTITITADETYIRHPLGQQNEMNEIIVSGKAIGAHINKMDPILTVNITGAELRKAACCNLSESFETNASVDVNYADAVTGAKQIQLLGLAGNYTQILTENIPAMYGLASAYGLNYIPGPWMESIQVAKGTSSVRNGYESIAGQINVEYKKPAKSEKIYLNGFLSDAGRQEINANTSVILNKNWSTMLMAHAENQTVRNDHNNDGFRDEPDVKQYHLFNRWDYLASAFDFRAGIKYLEEERIAGQLSYKRNNSDTWSDGFGINIRSKRFETFTKAGGVFGKDRSMSIGWIQNIAFHNQNSFFGRRQYEGTQKSYYSNLLYQYNPLPGKQTLDAGLSYKYDLFNEQLNAVPLDRKESVPGIFIQYTYADTAKITVVAGIRADRHNLFGTLITPRLHIRYVIATELTLRASIGKGYRSGNVLAENTFLLASSRDMIIAGDLRAEEAWNAGMSLTGKIPLFGNELKLSSEFFHTNFVNQIITDLDANIHEVRFYNLQGKSYSNVLQFEASGQFIEGLDLLAAWRWNDVRMTISDTLRGKPLSSRYKGLFTASYLTHLRKWQYDFTLQLNGPGRIPSTDANPEMHRRPDSFKAFTVMNIQITRSFKKWHIYAGVENLLDFRQHMPVISAEDPFGEYFDSALIWGPVHGRKIYAGFRFILNRDVE
ncbi:MAG: TonB-dependent receptor [Odoribacter sp.]|nr:TonB-dependent receptor [Odoribacter sp.]